MTRRAEPRIELLPVSMDGRTIGHVHTDAPGERDEWELHPDEDELLYLVSGATDVLLRDDIEDDATERVLRLRGGEACIVPKGAWHRQVVHEPSVLFFVSPGGVHRPYVPAGGWSA